ncbi:MAG: hypothetical protein MJZ89_03705 [Paludibacteraceae bacterium]|nr:hypothetical protein [Paludibacteraceae bacterium]
MKKITWILCLLAIGTGCWAQSSSDSRYRLSLQGEVGHNPTWGYYSGALLHAHMPVVKNVDILADIELLSSNVYTAEITFRPKFSLPVGHLYMDATALGTIVARNQLMDIVGSLSLGYQMDYVNVQVGWFYRTIAETNRSWDSESGYVSDPFNLLYRLQINARPERERWNVYVGLGNVTPTQYERMWAPMFWLGGYYDLRPQSELSSNSLPAHFRLLAEVMVKPAGFFHLDASLYNLQTRFGIAYTF